MPADIYFPKASPCVLCAPYYDAEEIAPPTGDIHAPGIGIVCRPCAKHVDRATKALKSIPRIAAYPIPDGERNNSKSTIHNPKSRRRRTL